MTQQVKVAGAKPTTNSQKLSSDSTEMAWHECTHRIHMCMCTSINKEKCGEIKKTSNLESEKRPAAVWRWNWGKGHRGARCALLG